MEHLLQYLAKDKSDMIKAQARNYIIAEAERAWVFGNLQSEEDHLIDRLNSFSFRNSWETYKESILEPKLEEWGLGKDVILVIPD